MQHKINKNKNKIKNSCGYVFEHFHNKCISFISGPANSNSKLYCTLQILIIQ